MATSHRLEMVFVALLALAGASWGLAHLSLGGVAVAIALGIATIKATLVALELMELREAPTSLRLVAIAAPTFVLVLVVFALGDVLSR